MNLNSKDYVQSSSSDVLQKADESIRAATWADLLVYIVAGIGLFFSASFILGKVIQEVSLLLTVLAALLNFICLAGSVYVFGVLRKKVSWNSLGLFPVKKIFEYAIWGAALAFAINFIRIFVAYGILLLEWLIFGEITSLTIREEMFSVGLDTWQGISLMLLGVGVLAPIAEELFFRGLLYDFFRQKIGVVWGVVVSSLMFGVAHYDSLAVVVSSFLMGIALALAYEKTRSLWISIFMHVSTNSGAILLTALITRIGENLLDLQY